MDPEEMTAEELAEYLEWQERQYEAGDFNDDDPLDCNPNLW
jgi:hypothetical protein